MGKIEYLIGRTVDARQRLIDDKMSSGDIHSILHLVPTKGRVMELESDPRFWPNRRINTLTGLIYRIFEEDVRHKHYDNFKPIDETLRHLLVKKALIKRSVQPDGLIFFNRLFGEHNRKTDFTGVYRTIAGFFSRLVRNNYQDMFAHDMAGKMIRFEEISTGSGEERYALESDLTWLFGDFEEIKREIRGYDDDDIISSVRGFLIEGGIPTALAGVNVIIFDGFIQLSRIEEDIIFYLFRQTDEVWWPIDYDSRVKDPIGEFKDSSGRETRLKRNDKGKGKGARPGGKEAYRVFASLVSLMDRLEEAGEESMVVRATEEAYLNPVAGGLYMGGRAEEPGSDTLKIKSFSDRVEEVKAIAGEIKRIILEDNLDVSRDLGKIRIVFPDLNDYSSIISEIFGEYGLPFSLTRGLPLISHPISNIFLDIFKISVNNFKREDMFNLFSSDLILRSLEGRTHTYNKSPLISVEYLLPGDSVSDVEGLIDRDWEKAVSGRIDIFLYDRVAGKCGLNYLGDDLSGLKSESLIWVRDFFQDRILKLKDPAEREILRSEYYGFIIQCGLMAQILKPFLELANQNNPKTLSEHFSRILDKLGFPENIINVPEQEISLEPGTARSMLKRDVKAYSVLEDMISACAREMLLAGELFNLGKGRELLSEFYSIFRNRLNSAYLLDERDPNVIRVSQLLETRGRSFDYIFAGGMTSDRFPLREDMDFILPDSPGKVFRLVDTVDLSKHLFSHLLRNYRKRLYFSYPRYREERPLQPSQVLVDLESMVEADKPVIGTLEDLFKWDDNPYLTSGQEMLNASIPKGDSWFEIKPGLFQLKDVLLIEESSAEGLIRGINSISSRSAVDGLFEYDGLVGSAERFRESLDGRKAVFSSSQLECLANCPMRYLFEYVYGLKGMEELGPEASPVDRGDYLHEILGIFFQRLKGHRMNVSDIGLGPAFSRIMEVVRDHFMKSPFLKSLEFFKSLERDLLEGLEQDGSRLPGESNLREGIFARLLRFEERAFTDRLPAGIEYEFGYQRPPALLGKIRMRGFIDRFDQDRQDENRFYIYDYKSGRPLSSAMVKKGLSFQLPVYIRALKSGPDNIKKVSASIYSLRREDLLKEEPILLTISDHKGGIKGLDITGVSLMDDYADQLMENLENGCFHHSADGIRCDYCEYARACHMDPRRMDHLLDSGMDEQIYSGIKNLNKWKKVDQFRKEWRKVIESMKKSFDLKSEAGRKRHFESVVDFKAKMAGNRDSLPFHEDYINELIFEIEEFEEKYSSKSFN